MTGPQDKLTRDQQPIIALCSPSGAGALALLRISGVSAVELTDSFVRLSSNKKLTDLASHTIHHGYIINTSNSDGIIDNVMFLLMRAPRTFTGQDTVEITCHNNPIIIKQIIERALTAGAKTASGGEFTQRALLCGKINLSQAEAIHDVITSQNEAALQRSMSQLQGSLSQKLSHIEKQLLKVISTIEASFEFLEEEQRDVNFSKIISRDIENLLNDLSSLKYSADNEAKIRNGVRIVLAGPTNVGKSTLFNSLLQKNRAIVSSNKGTTRDSIESFLTNNNQLLCLVDTAGIHETDNVVEQEGISRTMNEMLAADVILLVVDISETPKPTLSKSHIQVLQQYEEKTIIVLNKCDTTKKPILNKMPQFSAVPAVNLSAKTGTGIENLKQAISKKINLLFNTQKSPFLLNKRQRSLVIDLFHTMRDVKAQIQQGVEYETIACSLREALNNLSGLSGKNLERQVMDEIFRHFCVGK